MSFQSILYPHIVRAKVIALRSVSVGLGHASGLRRWNPHSSWWVRIPITQGKDMLQVSFYTAQESRKTRTTSWYSR